MQAAKAAMLVKVQEAVITPEETAMHSTTDAPNTIFEPPAHWSPHKTPTSIEKVQLDEGSDELKRVQNWFLLPSAIIKAVFRVRSD